MQTVADRLAAFVEQYKSVKLLSTRAEVVDYHGTLYNITGSSDDPEIDGATWKRLLIKHGIDGACFVKVTDPQGSHPQFDVGGHMTPNSDGKVAYGETCYLMPLCKWHNSTSRNGQAFALTQSRILKLYGYMQGELSLTFMARMPSEAPFSLIYETEGAWHTRPLSDAGGEHSAKAMFKEDDQPAPTRHVLLRRVEHEGEIRFLLEDAQL